MTQTCLVAVVGDLGHADYFGRDIRLRVRWGVGGAGAGVQHSGGGEPVFSRAAPEWAVAVRDLGDRGVRGGAAGALYAYAIDADGGRRSTSSRGRLSLINVVGSGGRGPCHASVDATGRYLLAANYHGGSVCVAPISDDGGLEPLSCFIQHEGSSVNPDRQEQAHAHSINLDAQNRFAYVPDLGQDKVVIYRLDLERGELVANDPAYVETDPGFGPRHFDFHPERPAGVCHQRAGKHGHGLRVRRRQRGADSVPDGRDAAVSPGSTGTTRRLISTFTRRAGSCTARTGAMTASPSSRWTRRRGG